MYIYPVFLLTYSLKYFYFDLLHFGSLNLLIYWFTEKINSNFGKWKARFRLNLKEVKKKKKFITVYYNVYIYTVWFVSDK